MRTRRAETYIAAATVYDGGRLRQSCICICICIGATGASPQAAATRAVSAPLLFCGKIGVRGVAPDGEGSVSLAACSSSFCVVIHRLYCAYCGRQALIYLLPCASSAYTAFSPERCIPLRRKKREGGRSLGRMAAAMPAGVAMAMARTNHHNVLTPTSPGSIIKRRQTIHPAATVTASPGKTGSSTPLKRRGASMTTAEISRHAGGTDENENENEDGSNSLSPRSECGSSLLPVGRPCGMDERVACGLC